MGRRDQFYMVVTLVMLGLTVLTLACYVAIGLNPYFLLNPFPPPPLGTQIAEVPGTPTATPSQIERNAGPTWTPTATPTITPTPPPSFTPTATHTPGPPIPTATRKPTVTPTPRVTRSPLPFTYELEYQTPHYSCDWMGVAGLVQDLDGNPLEGYPIHVWGGGIDQVMTSGSKQMYGDSGWEQFFTNAPMEISGTFHVQLHSRDNPNHPPISQEITLDFTGLCSESLAFIVFTQNH